ncbi:MAG: hypothetical protein HY689_16000 [Chloroflexi bacterium]|nr:hypothetical protein [Chloroflexota bacterium]
MARQDVPFQTRDFFRQSLTEPELRALLGGRSAADAFSWRSPSVKALGLDVAAVRATEEEMVRLMLQEPRLIRRPILVTGDAVIFGATEHQAASALAGRA